MKLLTGGILQHYHKKYKCIHTLQMTSRVHYLKYLLPDKGVSWSHSILQPHLAWIHSIASELLSVEYYYNLCVSLLSCLTILSVDSYQGYPQTWQKRHPHSMLLAPLWVLVWSDVFIFTFSFDWLLSQQWCSELQRWILNCFVQYQVNPFTETTSGYGFCRRFNVWMSPLQELTLVLQLQYSELEHTAAWYSLAAFDCSDIAFSLSTKLCISLKTLHQLLSMTD